MALPIGARSSFLLYEMIDRASPPWRNFRLINIGVHFRDLAQRRAWRFGFNGKRLSRNKDTMALAQHLPGIEQWVISLLSGDREV
jgi:hypothetical protein